MDFAIAFLLFTFTLAVYFGYTNNFQREEQSNLDALLADAKSISSSLVLSGYPADWDNSTVIRIGIADEQKVNATKWKTFKKLNYTATKRKFGTPYEYFTFFVNSKGEVLNINGVCGVGSLLVKTAYNVRSAYYYSSESDKFLKDFMNDSFHADIYFGDNPGDIDDIDSMVSNLSKYGFLVIEHPLLTVSTYNQIKDELENYSSRGGLLMISGELVTSQNRELAGADFKKKSGQSVSDRNSTVNNTDQYLSFAAGDGIVFAQAYYVENKSASANFVQIATFNQDGANAVAKWKYGNGTAYFFSDFDVSYFNGDFVNIVEDAAKSLNEGTCYPINFNSTGLGVKQLVKTERYLSHNSKAVKMVTYVWQ